MSKELIQEALHRLLYRNSQLDSKPAEVFRQAADFLFNHCRLKIKDTYAELTELEFYYRSENHPDPYVHAASRQQLFGEWYLHRHKNDRTIKEGTWKGMDLTFGRQDIFGGILIRGIRIGNENNFVSGPCRFVNFLLAEFGYEKASGIAKRLEGSVLDNEILSLEAKPAACQKVLAGRRIGLSDPHTSLQLKYRALPYRFITAIQPAHKFMEKERVVWNAWQGGAVTETEIRAMLGYLPDLKKLTARYGKAN